MKLKAGATELSLNDPASPPPKNTNVMATVSRELLAELGVTIGTILLGILFTLGILVIKNGFLPQELPFAFSLLNSKKHVTEVLLVVMPFGLTCFVDGLWFSFSINRTVGDIKNSSFAMSFLIPMIFLFFAEAAAFGLFATTPNDAEIAPDWYSWGEFSFLGSTLFILYIESYMIYHRLEKKAFGAGTDRTTTIASAGTSRGT